MDDESGESMEPMEQVPRFAVRQLTPKQWRHQAIKTGGSMQVLAKLLS